MALPWDPRLVAQALVTGAGLSRQSLGIRPWMDAFQVGGPRIHRNYGQPIQTHFDQETAMMRKPEQTMPMVDINSGALSSREF